MKSSKLHPPLHHHYTKLSILSCPTSIIPRPPILKPQRALLTRHNGNSTGHQWLSFTRSPVCIIIPKLFDNMPINSCHRQSKTEIEEALHSIQDELRVLAEGNGTAHRAKTSTLKSREVGVRTELELIEAQIAEYAYFWPSVNL